MKNSKEFGSAKMKTTIEILGKGGDGTQTLANIIGEAAVLEKKIVLSTLFMMRWCAGGVSNSRIIISNDEILNPIVEIIDIIIDLNNDNTTLKIGDDIKKIKIIGDISYRRCCNENIKKSR